MTVTPCLTLPNTRTHAQARAEIDLNKRTFTAAYQHARNAAFASMRAEKRDTMNAADKAAGDAVLIRLLWHVEGSDGGFIGLDDDTLEMRCRRMRLDEDDVARAMWAPGDWPTVAAAEQVAA